MANTTISPNMSMPLPVVGQDPGPQYGTDQNSCFTILDQHDHSLGNGVKITPSGMNINANLSFGGNSATSLVSAVFTSQSAAITGTNFVSVVGGNLYFNDSSGNQIPITSGGGVAGSPGSIGSLASPAAATYSAGSKTFFWTSGSSKAAAMDNGSVTIRETNVASAKGITLASPTALAADYSLTLFGALPASTKYVSCDSSGNLANVSADTIGAAMTSTGATAVQNIATSNIVTSTAWALNGGGATSFTDITNATVTITTHDRPIMLILQSATTSVGSGNGTISAQESCYVQLVRDGVALNQQSIYGNAGVLMVVPLSSLCFIDSSPGSASRVYKLQYRVNGGSAGLSFGNAPGSVVLVAIQL